MKSKIAAVLVLGAVGVGAVIYTVGGLNANAASPTQYLTANAAVGDVTQDVAATGTIEAAARYGVLFGADPYLVTDSATAPSVTAKYPVTKVDVKVGDTVKKGDTLATADTKDLERQLEAAQNSLASAKVSLRAANTSRDDADASGNTGQIRQAKIGQYSAENQVADAQQQVTDLKAQIKAAKITAPIDGLVTEVDVQPGFDAPSGPAVIIDSSTFEITTDVVESDLADVAVGQDAAISIAAIGSNVTGKVSTISPTATTSGSVVSYPVTVTLAEAPAKARSGMTADVTITIASATNVLTVPAAALRGTDGDYRVLTLGADGTPVSTAVQVGLVTNTAAEIKSGLDEGTAVVIGTAAQRTGTTTTGGFGGVGIPGVGPGGGQIFRNGGGGNNRGNGGSVTNSAP
jgi:macrolide-specific efflux system membrane fusion protein